MKQIKLFVDKNVTSCSCLRRKKEGSKDYYSTFECGIDLVEHLWVASYPHVYGHSLKDLVENICRWYMASKPKWLDNTVSLHISNDVGALMCGYDEMDDDYWRDYEEISAKVRKAFEDVQEDALRGLEYDPEEDAYVGIITIYENI